MNSTPQPPLHDRLPPTRDELANTMRKQTQAEQEKYEPEEKPRINTIYELPDYLAQKFPPPVPLIGTKQNALLVRGEGIFEAGRSGVGKTMFMCDMSIKMAAGFNIFNYPVSTPLKVLIYQAELPNTYFQLRLKNLFEAYSLGDKERMAATIGNIFIADVNKPFNMAEKNNTAVEIIGEDADKCNADAVIIDPFLSFYSGDENINPEVRRGLDLLKTGVAEKLNLGLMISDHIPKNTTDNGQQVSMRGAGAKHDWSSSVMLVSSVKTPAGEHGDFLSVYMDKVRYGPKPRDPFIVKRDHFSGLHSWWRGETVDPVDVAKLLNDQGGELSLTKMREAAQDEFQVSRPVADRFISAAIDEGFISTEKGKRNATVHVLTEKYKATTA